MNTSTQERIQRLIKDGYQFKFGHYIGEAFDLLQKNIGGFILYTLLFMVIYLTTSLIPIINIFNIFLLAPLFFGIVIVGKKVKFNERTEFRDFFKGFDHFLQIAVMLLLIFVISLIVSIPLFFYLGKAFISLFGDLSALSETDLEDPLIMLEIFSNLEMNFLIVFLLWAPFVYLRIAWYWAPMLIIFKGMSAWEAMETSRKIITKNWPLMFLFVIVISLMAALGTIVFLIGLLVTIPIMELANFAAFADIVGLEEDEEVNDFIEHLVE